MAHFQRAKTVNKSNIMKKLSQLFAYGCLLLTVNTYAQNQQNSQALKLNILAVDAHAFPKVLVSFKADNKNGIPYWNLTKNNMQLMEDGQSCSLSTLKPTVSSQPISVSIVVDHSGSMDEDHSQLYDKDGKPLFTIDKNDNMVVADDYMSPIDNAKNSIKHFTASFDTHKDFISITGFGTAVDRPLALTNNDALINRAVENLKAEGKTALYDGMIEGVKQLKNGKGIKVLVVLTDGEDNMSKATSAEVIDLAVKENIPVYIIGLGDVNKSTLNQISEATNGLFFYTRTSTTLQSIYAMISQRVKAVYQAEYISPDTHQEKKERALTVSAEVNNFAVINDQATYQLPETTRSSISPVSPSDNNNTTISSVVESSKIPTAIQTSPKKLVSNGNVFDNEKDIFWIFGNIILAGFIAAWIIFYKKRKQVDRLIS